LKTRIFYDAKTLLLGFATSIFALMLLGVWRRLDLTTFLFIQILALTFLLYIILLLIGKRKIPFVASRELSVVLIVFLVATSTTLNIDRSRSFATLKWVSQIQESGPVKIEEIRIAKGLSAEEAVAVEQRIYEQVQIGSLIETPEGVSLSRMGAVILWFAENIATLCNLKDYKNF